LKMTTVNDIDFKGQRVLVRVDFNVPLNDQLEVTDDTRIRATIPTVKAIIKNNGIPVLMSHLGRPKGGYEKELSLKNIVETLEKLSEQHVLFASDCIGDDVVKLTQQANTGEVVLLENLRFYTEESKGDLDFAKKLANNGDFYVNDAFGTAHRAHASTAIIADFFEGKKAFGLVMAAEIENVSKILNEGKSPVTAIVGGAKVSSKISILENLIPTLDNLIIGGGMAFTFIKAKGGKVGSSLVENDYLETAQKILEAADRENVKVILPEDSVNANSFSNEADQKISKADAIEDGWMGLDVGPQTLNALEEVLLQSKTILWNGPMGVFEFSNFERGTREVAKLIAKATEGGAFSLVGGGDSVAAIKKFGMEDEVSYVSTGGGAMLEYLEGKELPGIKAISQ